MKVFKEMHISSGSKDISTLTSVLSKNCQKPWYYNAVDYGKNYINVEYVSESPCSADIALYFDEEKNKYSIVNIVPINKNKLSIEEYNEILDKFYEFFRNSVCKEDFIIDFSKSGTVSKRDLMCDKTVSTLDAFSNLANKATGSSHPLDRDRWYSFILQAFNSKDYFNLLPDHLENLLIEDYKWSENKAAELVNEFEFAIGLLEKMGKEK